MTDVKIVAKALQVLPLPADDAALESILAPLRGEQPADETDQSPPGDPLDHPGPG